MGRFHFVDLLFVLLFFIQSTQFCFCNNMSFNCIERERQALLNFTKSFNDPSQRLSSWEGTGCCQWEGVSCSPSTGDVVKLDLGWNSFEDQLVVIEMNPSLLELKYLNYLDLSGIDFQGSTIPKFFGLMIQLEYLTLNSANITGIVPRQLGNLTNLQVLDLHAYGGDVRVRGVYIKDLNWVSPLKSLRYLDMSNIDLSGASNSMHVFKMLPFLQELHLSKCTLDSSHLPRSSFYSTFLSAIQHLDLSQNSISQNSLPFFLQNMTALRVLDLSFNSFNSSIPLWLGNLKNLVHLILARNQFHGPIPASIGNLSTLSKLDLSHNQLNGVIPATIGNLSALSYLDLSYNLLNGAIPESLGQLSNLEVLYVNANSLEGALSEIHFTSLSKLRSFDISVNHLSTFIMKPEWVPPFQLTYITMKSCCNLGTQFPQWLETQKKVVWLDLSNTSISGPLPNWLWSMDIYVLVLSNNRITGPLPRNIGDMMPTLNYLYLADNLINGTIPSSFSKIGNLKYLDLSRNRFTGPLPRMIGDTVPTLQSFYVANNLINGTIPSSFCKIDSLEFLDLSNNMVSGDIPNCWSGSNRLSDLKLSANKLSGVLPDSIGHLSKLEWLHLKNNSLEGEVPLSLRNCTSLKLLNLGENRFSGNIPTWNGESLSSLEVLRLQKNKFNGYIPQQLCQLTTLKVLDLATNNLSGTIPQCFGDFSGMVLQQTTGYPLPNFIKQWDEVIVFGYNEGGYTQSILQVSVDLSDNNLIGMIPEELTILSGLHGLNLSHNHFTGSIPKNVGNLTSLESLDFSANKLSGNIPTSMSVLTSLRILNLSYNNFSGPIPTGRQLQTLVDPSIYAGNPELCGDPLVKKCSGDELPQAPIPDRHEENDEDDKSEEVWFYIIPVLGYITGLWGVLGVLLFKKSWRYAYFQLVDNVIDWIYVEVAIKSAWLKKKMAKNHAAN